MPTPEIRLDALEAYRMSKPKIMLNAAFRYAAQHGLIFSSTASGSGTLTHDSTVAGIKLGASGTSGDLVTVQSDDYYGYHVMGSLRFLCSCFLTAANSNQRARWGLFDANDGYFFEAVAGALSIVKRSSVSGSPVDTAIAKVSWNKDTQAALNTLYANNYEIRIRDFGGSGQVDFFVNGVHVHRLVNSNIGANPGTKHRVLPFRSELQNTSTSSAGFLVLLGVSVHEENAEELPEIAYHANHDKTGVGTASFVPVLSIRAKSLVGSLTNKVRVTPRLIQLGSNDPMQFALYLNPTLTGASYTDVDAAYSGVDKDTTASALTGGTLLAVYNTAGADDTNNVKEQIDLSNLFGDFRRKLRYKALLATPEILTIAAKSLASSGSGTARVSITWSELQ